MEVIETYWPMTAFSCEVFRKVILQFRFGKSCTRKTSGSTIETFLCIWTVPTHITGPTTLSRCWTQMISLQFESLIYLTKTSSSSTATWKVLGPAVSSGCSIILDYAE